MDKCISNKISIFKIHMLYMYDTYGLGNLLRLASNLYEDNLNLEEENLVLNLKLEKYKKETERLQQLLSDGVDEMTENLLSDSLNTVTSRDILI